MEKNVLLIDPFYNGGYVPPNWILGKMEAELLQDGINVRVIDFVDPSCEINNYDYFQKKENEFIKKILKEIIESKIKVVYITSSYGIPLKPLPVFPRIIKIAQKIKSINNQAKIIVGGAGVTYAARMLGISFEKIPEKKYIDFFVIGDEEKSLTLIRRILKLKNIRRNKNYYPQIIWKNWDFKKYPPYISLLTTKGCPYRCKFCFEHRCFDEYIKYDVINILDNIKTLIALRGIDRFAIEDSTFLAHPQLEVFLNYLFKEKIRIRFSAYGRVDEVIKRKNLLSKMKKVGCSNLLIGIETPKNEILEKEGKLITTHLSLKAVKLLKQNNINIQGCFMLIFPSDSLQDIENTIEFAYSLNLHFYRWHIFQPNFSSKEIQEILKNKIIPLDYLKVQLNVPDSCLPDVLEKNPLIALFDEHCLIRALPYLRNDKKLLQIKYPNISFQQAFKLIKEKLVNKQKSFNEEKNYNLI